MTFDAGKEGEGEAADDARIRFVFLVFGGGRFLGAAEVARLLADAGARLYLASRLSANSSNPDRLARVSLEASPCPAL